MRGKMIPMSLPRCAWVASVSVRPQIENMLDTGSHLVYGMGDISKGYPETLTGLPIIWSEHAAALGSETDLSLIDFSYYIIKPGTGPVINTSNDLYMLTRQTAIMMWWKVDGKSWLNLPILLRDGSTQVSPFVILD
jgi:HK97 family phage major capsid protein